MNPFVTILRFELRAALRERTLPLLFALFALGLGYALWNGLRWTAARTEAFAYVARDLKQVRDDTLKRFRDSETRDPTRAISPASLAAGLWYRPTLPLAPLAFVAVGQADRFPYETRFHPTNIRAVFIPRAVSVDHPAESTAGRFDVAFVLVTVLPLLLLASCFDAWVRDRETGVARLLLAQPVSLTQLVLAKVLARGGTLLAACVALLVAALALGARSAGLPFDATGAALAAVATLGYGAFWLGLALIVNLAIRTASAGAVVAGAIWIALVGLAPAGLGTLLDLVRPPADAGALANALRVDELEQDEAEARAAAEPRPAGPRPSALETALASTQRQKQQRAELRKPFEAQDAARRELADTLRLLVPSVALQDTLERLAGHDAARALSFQGQVWSYIDGLHAYIRSPAAASAAGQTLDERYALVPRFTFRETAGPENTALIRNNLLLLLAAAAITAVAAGLLARENQRDEPQRVPLFRRTANHPIS